MDRNDVVELRWRGPFRSYNILLTVEKQAPQAVIALGNESEAGGPFRNRRSEFETTMIRPLVSRSSADCLAWPDSYRLAATGGGVAPADRRRIGSRADGHVLRGRHASNRGRWHDLSRLGALVSLRNLSLSDSECANEELRHVSACTSLTDWIFGRPTLPTQACSICDLCRNWSRSSWLKLQVSGLGLEPLGQLENLRMLPLGRTQVADEAWRT